VRDRDVFEQGSIAHSPADHYAQYLVDLITKYLSAFGVKCFAQIAAGIE
jgi:hypothetical protein